MIGLVIQPRFFTVHIDPRLMILTPGEWPSDRIGNTAAEGLTVEAYDEQQAVSTVAHRTGVSQAVLMVATQEGYHA